MMMLIFYSIIRLTLAVASLALFSLVPAAGQASPPLKLSPQQLNPPTLNKPSAAPGTYSPNGNKLVAAPGTSSPDPNKLNAAPNKSSRTFQGPIPYVANPHSGRNVAARAAAFAADRYPDFGKSPHSGRNVAARQAADQKQPPTPGYPDPWSNPGNCPLYTPNCGY
jgi:hypothetical protein